jgi:hypothetical protein
MYLRTRSHSLPTALTSQERPLFAGIAIPGILEVRQQVSEPRIRALWPSF